MNRAYPGRPRVDEEIEELLVHLATDNRRYQEARQALSKTAGAEWCGGQTKPAASARPREGGTRGYWQWRADQLDRGGPLLNTNSAGATPSVLRAA